MNSEDKIDEVVLELYGINRLYCIALEGKTYHGAAAIMPIYPDILSIIDSMLVDIVTKDPENEDQNYFFIVEGADINDIFEKLEGFNIHMDFSPTYFKRAVKHDLFEKELLLGRIIDLSSQSPPIAIRGLCMARYIVIGFKPEPDNSDWDEIRRGILRVRYSNIRK